jgi:hypothetical protein
MPPLHTIVLAGALLLSALPEFLEEPGYAIVRDGDQWVVRKPAVGARRPVTISRHDTRDAAESRRRSLPRLRLNGQLMRYDPATQAATSIADWTGEEDARQVEADVRDILSRFAPAGLEVLLQSTPVHMARLFGATGHTAEDSADPSRFVVYLDPFRATGRLHAASTLLHELAHLERYRARGFHANRAAAVLPKEDFVLLGLADELAAYEAEVNLVRSFLDSLPENDARRAAREAMRSPDLGWPLAVTVLLDLEGPSGRALRMAVARRQVVLDLERNAGSYWQSRHRHPIDAPLREKIRNWRQASREWQEIAAQRPEWEKARPVRR